MFLDIKSAFPSVAPDRLVHNMRMKGVSKNLTDWISRLLESRTTSLCFDGFTSDHFTIMGGLSQGCPLSVILHHFYNAYGMEVPLGKRDSGECFIDDTSFGCEASTFEEAHSRLDNIMT